jgi:hypothetical protein
MSGTDINLDVSKCCCYVTLVNNHRRALAAAFLEFHEPLAAFLFPRFQRNNDDTLLTSDEVYHSFVKVNVTVYVSEPA